MDRELIHANMQILQAIKRDDQFVFICPIYALSLAPPSLCLETLHALLALCCVDCLMKGSCQWIPDYE